MSVDTAKSKTAEILLAEPADLEALFYLASLASGDEDWPRCAEQTAESLDGLSDADARRAAAWYAIGPLSKAVAYAEKAADHPLGAIILGINHENNGRHEEAYKFFQRAARGAPTVAPFALKPIDSLRRRGKLDEAMEMAERQRRQFSDKPELDFFLGRVYEDSGRYQDALDSYRRSIDIAPTYAECLFRAAYLADLRGLDSLAKEFYSRIGPESNRVYVHACLNLALIHEDEEDYDQAVVCCRRALKIAPANRRAKLFLANAEAAANMYYSPEETKQSERLEAILRVPVSDFELSVRSRNCLSSMNILCLGDLIKRTESEMLAYKNFGETSLREIKEMLAAKGLRLGMMREDAATRQAMERQRRNASSEILGKSIDELELGVRARKCMETLGIATIGELVDKSESELASARNFGRVSLTEIKKKLNEMGLSFKDSQE
ncbi:MAG: tetratricopeptide repeat protein [Planctomycetota bacterium]|jgi:DNA-directed RNA polymerase subunit alpha|nr:tetratricopeptide repeat protein [Planctomycetota bacterium]